MDAIPVILKSLLPRSTESIICSDLSPKQVALIQLHESIVKKYEPTGENQAADKAALDLFIESSELCKLWEPDETSYHYSTMCRARELLKRRFFGGELQAPRVTLAKALDRLRPGPGSSLGAKGQTDFIGKLFFSKLTTYDKSLWHFYKDNVPTIWRAAEHKRQKQYGECCIVKSSKLTYAKKYFNVSRVINTEASVEMLFQLGVGDLLEDCLRDWFNISLDTQPTINRFLARIGSIYGSHATVDLKTASDLIAQRFTSWFFCPQMYKPLDSIRAKCIELPDGNIHELGTFSTMGNGFTFPMQTLIFACIVEAAYEELGLSTYNFGMIPSFSVFGDDIVCVKQAYDKVLGLLEWCGFRVNRTKSFNTGSFRESCGQDFFKGHDVRGIYVRKFSHETHRFSVFNRLTRWSVRNGVDLGDLLRHIKGLVEFRPIPFDESDAAGIKVPYGLSGRSARRDGAIRYKCYRPKPKSFSTRRYDDNPLALELAALGGYIEGSSRLTSSLESDGVLLKYHHLFKPMPDKVPVGSVTVRDSPGGDPRVKLKRCSTHSWDWIPHKGLTPLDYRIVLLDVLS